LLIAIGQGLKKGVCVMLVLARKANEWLVIDGRIIVTVVRVAGGRVRLGIEAPADVGIQREELLSPSPKLDHVSVGGQTVR
jgi:carbon storage regulator